MENILSGKFAIIDEQFNLALNRNEFEIDPELEIAAGTLYHSVQDYHRATARFEVNILIHLSTIDLGSSGRGQRY